MANKLYEENDIQAIADAIRGKNKSSVTYTVSQMKNAIDNLPSGSSEIKSKKDVNFYDYDGTIVDSYTASEFANLTAMPDNPTHEGLTSQGWNWSLSDAKTYVADYGKLDVGQMYITDDGKTRIYIELEDGRLSPYLGLIGSGNVTVDWGDGNIEIITNLNIYNHKYTQHIYSNSGSYIITLSTENFIKMEGNAYGSRLITKKVDDTNSNQVYLNSIKKIELGTNIQLTNYSFAGCQKLKTITIPRNISAISGSNTFYNCYSLKSICFPNTVSTLPMYVMFNCIGLTKVILPNTITNLNFYGLAGAFNLFKISLPSSLTSIKPNTFYNCTGLVNIIIPDSVTTIDSNAFENCYNLISIKISKNLSTIASKAFRNCYGMIYYDFSNNIAIPTLSSTDAFTNIPSDCKIIVPDELYEDWTVATNWSTYADYIVKASEV